MIAGHDDWSLYMGVNSKKIFECYIDNKGIKIEITNLNKAFKNNKLDVSIKAIKAADSRLGYFILSECPKQVQKKEFPIKF